MARPCKRSNANLKILHLIDTLAVQDKKAGVLEEDDRPPCFFLPLLKKTPNFPRE